LRAGLKAVQVLGKTVLEIMPDTEKFWIEAFGEVALTGKSAKFEKYSSQVGKRFQVTAFRPVILSKAGLTARKR